MQFQWRPWAPQPGYTDTHTAKRVSHSVFEIANIMHMQSILKEKQL